MKSLKLILIILASIVAVVLTMFFGFQNVRNRAISYDEQIRTALSDINVQEKRRSDLIPNLVDCVKAYDKHEYQTLMDVIKARGTSSDESIKEVQSKINVVVERYPELKNNDNYRELMNELSTTENLIANYRSDFNNWIKKYNQYIKQFPNKQILSALGYEPVDWQYLDYGSSSDAPTNLFGGLE